MDKLQDPEAAETAQTTNVPAVDLSRLVRLLWVRTTPTKNGYYWYREHVQHRAVIYDVVACERFGFAQKWDGSTKPVKLMTGWWAGPIPKPEPPSLPNASVEARQK